MSLGHEILAHLRAELASMAEFYGPPPSDALYDRELKQLRAAMRRGAPPADMRDPAAVAAWLERVSLELPAGHPMRFRRQAPAEIRVPSVRELQLEAARLRAAGELEEADQLEETARRRELVACGCKGRRCPYHPKPKEGK